MDRSHLTLTLTRWQALQLQQLIHAAIIKLEETKASFTCREHGTAEWIAAIADLRELAELFEGVQAIGGHKR